MSLPVSQAISVSPAPSPAVAGGSELAETAGYAAPGGRADELLRAVDDRSFPDGEAVTVRTDSRFREGAIVYHPTYGEGRISRLEGSGDDLKVSVHFIGHGTKKFLAGYAPFTFRK